MGKLQGSGVTPESQHPTLAVTPQVMRMNYVTTMLRTVHRQWDAMWAIHDGEQSEHSVLEKYMRGIRPKYNKDKIL